jgi:hypothetical protein
MNEIHATQVDAISILIEMTVEQADTHRVGWNILQCDTFLLELPEVVMVMSA